MATINLGAIKFNWKGAYNNGTTYAVDDVVSSGGNSYVCIQAHSNQAVGNATAYWNIMSSAGTNGTNGTDLTSTLTAQGDMLYRDGSGLQRLAKGTASQELRMNSGATAPEWHTPAVATSDFVKVASGSHSGAYLTVDNCFTATYKIYKVYVYNYAGGNYMRMNWRTGGASGANYSASDYRFRTKYYARSGSSDSDTGESGWNESTFRLSYNGNNSSEANGIEITVPDPLNTTTKTNFWSIRNQVNGASTGVAIAGGYNDSSTSTTKTGFRFYAEGSSSYTCNWAVYGQKG
jgi:hypothetical protein